MGYIYITLKCTSQRFRGVPSVFQEGVATLLKLVTQERFTIQQFNMYSQEEAYLDPFPMTRSASNRQEFRTTNVMDCINLNILVIANIQEIKGRLAH